MELSRALADKRSIDRRSFSWRTAFFGFARSRRLNLRRVEDAEVLFLDWHHPWLFFLAVGTMIMSCVDAFMTLQLLQHGMIEANPIMAAVLDQSTMAFAVSKITMTGASILVLVYLAKIRFMNQVRVGLFLTVIFSFYACLICYEFVSLLGAL
jgi:hypothetical protein